MHSLSILQITCFSANYKKKNLLWQPLTNDSFHVYFCHRISLAEAHCKLCLRTRVLEEDAVIAVLLCENSVTLKHGTDFLYHPPH